MSKIKHKGIIIIIVRDAAVISSEHIFYIIDIYVTVNV